MSEKALGKADSCSGGSGKNTSHVCDHCGAELADASGLQRHIRLNHPDELDHNCPSCQKSFPTERGLKLHHTRSHNEQLLESAECDECGSEFQYRNGRQTEPRFCDRSCRDSYQTGENHPNYQGGKVELSCEWCGDGFLMNPNKSHRRFCDKWCAGEWRSETKCGEDNPQWKGGKVEYYGPNWQRQRRRALKRDQYRCRECGATEQQLGTLPSVHHRTKIRHFKKEYDAPEWYELANGLENLITLCEKHHRKWEQLPVQPPAE